MSWNVDNRVREARRARGWSQHELAGRAGISRAAVSAIEVDRLVPSTAAALALAGTFRCRVEDLFRLPPRDVPEWAWRPVAPAPVRYWVAEVNGRNLRYPVEPAGSALLPHDGWAGRLTGESDSWSTGPAGAEPISEAPWVADFSVRGPTHTQAGRTLVVAGCDPAVGLLGGVVSAGDNVRLLPFVRSSRASLELLRQQAVHVAGVHLGDDTAENREVIRSILGSGYRTVHLTRWTEGVALAPTITHDSVSAAVAGRLHWVAREEGSGARRILDEVLAEGPGGWTLAGPSARDHRGVAEVLRAGWAEAGVCVQIAAEEAGLPFLPVRMEAYDLCYPEEFEADARLEALLRTVRSREVRSLFAQLPGYDARAMGEAA